MGLAKKGASCKYIDRKTYVYKEVSINVCNTIGRIKEFSIINEVHQGSALGFFLFAIVMDELTRSLQDDIPLYVMFAYDIVLINETKLGAQRKLEFLMDTWEVRDFKIVECRFSENGCKDGDDQF